LSTDALRDCYDREQNHKKAWICAILILAVLGCFINIYKPVPVYLKNNPDQIPLELEGLKGYVADGRDDWFVRLPNPDIEIRRLYSNESAVPLYITVGYYAYQERDKKYIHYTMQNLYENAEDCRIQVDANNYITAKKVLVKDEGRRLLILYWYDIDGEVTSDNIRAKFITAVRGIIKRQTNGSIVLVARKINAEDNVETVFGHQEKFVAAIYPYLREYLHSY
jgi:EpsI family protein